MKKTAKLLLITLIAMAGILPVSATVYHETTQKVTQFDYSHFTYTYIDANGVERTASIMDEATSPEQIKALVKLIYTNDTIPGIHYAYDFGGEQWRKIDYNAYAHANVNPSKPMKVTWDNPDPSDTIHNPIEDGMTLLMVNVKDSWYRSYANGKTDSTDFMLNNAISSVKLMPHFTRVHDAENPGYLYSFEGVTNRFFIISKGKPRASYWAPFYRLFEQISPVKGDGGHNSNDFIDEIKQGHPYPCYHDCTNVIGFGNSTTYDHWFEIASTGESYALDNLSIFIPDRRLEYGWNESKDRDTRNNLSDTHTDAQIFKNYENDEGDLTILPKVLMYTADLNAVATPSSETYGFYDINLDWSTSFTYENLGVHVPQHFYVYILNDDGTRTLIQDVQKDENGMVRVQNHSYQVEQTNEQQVIRYVITAHPINYKVDGTTVLRNKDVIDGSEDETPYVTISAESPVRTVIIPSKKYAFFNEVSEYRSRYHIESSTKQINIYKNTVSITPSSIQSYETIRPEAYRVYRKYGSTDKPIATVTFTPIDNEEGLKQYSYTVEYDNNTQDLGFLFDDEEPVTSGTITSFENSTVKVIDRFSESTAKNNHYDQYTYTFKEQKTNGYYACSDKYIVPVYKTTNNVGGEGRTLDEVIADTTHLAKATPDNTITFSVINNPAANVVNYEIRRLKSNNFKNYDKIGKAENFQNSGNYYIYALNDAGQLNELVGTETVGTEGGDITTHDINSSSDNQKSNYVPVINTLYNGDASKPNSYGCDIQSTLYPQVEVAITAMEKTEPFYGNGGDLMGYRVNLNITPKLPKSTESSINYVYYYRVWREIDTKNNPTRIEGERLLNREDMQSGGTQGTDNYWASDYQCLYTIYPSNEQVSINDLFIDWAYEGNKNVTYIVRLYATTIPGESGAGHDHNTMALNEGGNGKDYFIAEDKVTAKFNNGTPTSIGTVKAESQVASVTYYNAMGIASSRPHQGVNIVVTRYTDGSTKTEKVLK
ncbi:MAG: hypothetical protein IKW83_09115 [Muribaculaceae bacterium]|nr:hypothetical protein [Muribaculaceae bacterium]